MKIITSTTLLLTMLYTCAAHAQKAYDNVTYQAKIDGNAALLTLADGYLLASKIVVHSRYGDQVFLPGANEADKKGDLQFNAVKGSGKYKSNQSFWVIITGLNQTQPPSHLKGIYWNGRTRKRVIFNSAQKN